MSYSQAIKWGRKHPKGTRQPVIMSTGSGFWPSRGFLEGDYWPYVDACRAAAVEPVGCEYFYRKLLSARGALSLEQAVALTKSGGI